jgi:hypothetical protein
VDHSFVVHVDRCSCAIQFVGSFFARSSCASHSLGHSFSWDSSVGSYSCVILLWESFVGFRSCGSCSLLDNFVGCLLVGSFHVYSWIRSRDLEWGVLEGNFCTVES